MSPELRWLLALDAEDGNWRGQGFAFGGAHLDLADDLHPADDAAERGKALTVGLARTAEVERRLIPDADRERVARGVGRGARHRQRAVLVREPGDAGPLERDRGKEL